MTTAEKTQATIAAVQEYQAIYQNVKAPATPASTNDTLVQGMMKGLTEEIAAIISEK